MEAPDGSPHGTSRVSGTNRVISDVDGEIQPGVQQEDRNNGGRTAPAQEVDPSRVAADETVAGAAMDTAGASTSAAAAPAETTYDSSVPASDFAGESSSASDSSHAVGDVAAAAAGGGVTSSTGTLRQQIPQQREATSATASGGAMVPDKEDDDEDILGGGGGASSRQHTLQNYANRDSGAVMLESSPGSKGMGNLLLDSKDKYAISPCEDKQWAVLGLSEDILVRTIRISSHEKYSSLVKDFQVLASQTYPVNEWLDLGTFTAKAVQGEQTFDFPQPAFARYLKFKFLSHYGDEFYCTVSQIKVHGSTMLESFQHEWQQSSAEVREVQDMMKKDPTKPTATGVAGTTNGGVTSHSSGNDATSTPAPGGPQQSQAVPSNHAANMPSNDAGVEHRPHAASAATVPPGGKSIGGGGGASTSAGAGADTLAVEDIVRGVPAEMVVPASTTCKGPPGTDGSCREAVLADGTVGAVGTGPGEVAIGSGIPAMGGSAAGKHDGAREAGGGIESIGAERNGGQQGATTNEATGDGWGSPTGGGEASAAGEALGKDSKVATSEGGSGAHVSGQGTFGGAEGKPQLKSEVGVSADSAENASTGASSDAPGSAGASVSAEAGGATGEKQAPSGEEEPPPRKGIIHSTMEAISKAVHSRGEGTKSKDGGNKPEVVARLSDTSNGVASSSGGSIEDEDSSGGEDASSLNSASDATGGSVDAGVLGQEAIALEGDEVAKHIAAHETAAPDAVNGAYTPPVTITVSAGQADGDASGDASGKSDPGIFEGRGADGNPPSVDEVERGTVEPNEPLTSGAGVSSGEVQRPPAGPVDRGAIGASSSLQTDAEISVEGNVSEAVNARGGEQTDPNAGSIGGDSNLAEGGGAHTATETSGERDDKVYRQTAGSATTTDGQAAARIAPDIDSSPEVLASATQGGAIGVPTSQGAESAEPLVHVEETNVAALTAACLERLSFTEFREEVLSRTQQAQQSAGGGVAIGGQYESIFTTLMNKIKTLEINQSLFSLYIDDVHGCYQDVIGQVIREQERARASRSELLNAQAAHLVRVGDQWPAFQELQVKVDEVESRMLLSSMAWFTSLFCLLVLLCSCCLKVCGRLGREGFGGGGRGEGEGRATRRRGRSRQYDDYYEHDEWSPACGEHCGSSAARNGLNTASKRLAWRAEGGVRQEHGHACYAGRGEGVVDSPQRGVSHWAPADPEQMQGGGGSARLNSHGVSHFCVSGDVGAAVGDGMLEKRRW